MKKEIIIGITCFTLGILISSSVYAGILLSSDKITYKDTNVKDTLDNMFNEIVDGKGKIAQAITNKGINTSINDTFNIMADNINSIVTDVNPIYESKGHTRDSGGSSTVTMTATKDGYAFVFCSYAVTYENVGSLYATKNGEALTANFSSGGVGMHAFYMTPVVAGDVIVGVSTKVSGASQYAGGVTIVMI